MRKAFLVNRKRIYDKKLSRSAFGATLLTASLTAFQAAAQGPVTDVVTARCEIRQLPSTITLVGRIEPRVRSAIASEVAGLVESMPVRQGDTVAAGARLVKLNDDTLEFELAEAESQLAVRKARLGQWEFELKRVRRLFDVQQANDKEWYDAQSEHAAAEYSVVEQEAVVGRLRTELKKTEIVSPFIGSVSSLETEVGEWVPKGGTVLEILDLSHVLVRVDVPEYAIPFARQGDRATVKIDALGTLRTGVVKHIIRQADSFARTFPVEIELENADGALAAGMFARATVRSGPEEALPSVPKDAIIEKDGVQYVGMVMPGRDGGTTAMLMPVTTGADVDNWVAITSGNVREGMEVVVRGNERLFPFPMGVRVVDEYGTPVARATRGEHSR